MEWVFFPKKMKYTKQEVAARVADRAQRGTIVIDLIDDLDLIDGLDRVSPSQTREHKRGGNKLERHGAEASGTFTFVTIDDDRAIGTNHTLKKPRPLAPLAPLAPSAPEQEPWADCDPGALPDIGELIATPIPQWVPVVSPDPGTTPTKLVSPAEWDQWLVRT